MTLAPINFPSSLARHSRRWLSLLGSAAILVTAGIARGQSCTSCAGDSVELNQIISLVGRGTITITTGDSRKSFTVSNTAWTNWPASPYIGEKPELGGIPVELTPDTVKLPIDAEGYVSFHALVAPVHDVLGKIQPLEVSVTLGTCSTREGADIKTAYWVEEVEAGQPRWVLHEMTPANYSQDYRVRVRQDDDPANDPGKPSRPGPASPGAVPQNDEMPPVAEQVSQVTSLGRNGATPVGRVKFVGSVLSSAVTRADFSADIVASQSASVLSIADPLNASLPKQYKSPQALLTLSDITSSGGAGVRLQYFDAQGATAQPDGTYVAALTALATIDYVPVTTTIGTATVKGIKITETRGDKVEVYEYYAEPSVGGLGGTWKEVHNGVSNSVQETPVLAVDGVTLEGRWVEASSADAPGYQTHRIEKYQVFPWGQELVELVEDPNGAARTTTYEYYDSVPATSPYYGHLHLRHCSDGSWERYIYAESGHLQAVYRPWVNSPTSLAAIRALGENDCHVERYSYELVNESDTPRRTVVEKILGTVIKRTITSKYKGMDLMTSQPVEETVEEVRGNDGTLLSRNRSGRVGVGAHQSGRLAFTYREDGTGTHYDEQKGLPPGPGETLSRTETTITNGTLYHVQGVPRQHTRTVTVSNKEGVIERRTEVALGAGGFAPIEVETVQRQSAAPQETRRLDGVIVSTRTKISDLVEDTTDEVGVVTRTESHSSGEFWKATTNGIVREQSDDPSFTRTITHAPGSGLPSQQEYTYYDGLGRVSWQREKADSRIVRYGYVESTSGREEQVKDYYGTTVKTTTYYANGLLASSTGTSVTAEHHTYGVLSTGLRWEMTHYGSPMSSRWICQYTDGLGRVVREDRPAPHGQGTVSTHTSYNSKGQLVKVQSSGGISAPVIREYDALGRAYREGRDLNGNGLLDVASNEPITESYSEYEQVGSAWWETHRARTYFENGAGKFKESVSRRQIGFGPLNKSEAIFNGLKVTTSIEIDRSTLTKTTTTTRSDVSRAQVRVEVAGRLYSETSMEPMVTPTLYYYDGLGRMSRTILAGLSSAAFDYSYDSADRVTAVIDTPLSGSTWPAGSFINRSYQYYLATDGWVAGQLKSQTEPAARNLTPTTTGFAYNGRGQLTHQWGNGTYPVMYEYDEYGQKTGMKTYRTLNPNLWNYSSTSISAAFTTQAALASTTTWIYEAATGLLTAKQDDNGQGASYTYNSDGSLHQRTWARGTVTTYAYTPLGQVESLSYSDGTPAVSHTYHRNGMVKITEDASGQRTYNLDPATGLLSRESTETIAGGANFLTGLVIDRAYDNFGRPVLVHPQNVGALGHPGELVPAITTSYHGVYGKVSVMASGALQASMTYQTLAEGYSRIISRGGQSSTDTYHAIQGLFSSVHFGSSWRRSWRHDSTAPNTVGVMGANPGYTQSSTQPLWNYNFNLRGEVTRARRNQTSVPAAPYSASSLSTSEGNQLAGWSSTFSYDEIGNRVKATQGYDLAAEAGTVDYTVNSLNQYTSLSNSADVFFLGQAPTGSAVSVNGVTAVSRTSTSPWGPSPVNYDTPFRQGGFFSARLQADNASGPDWLSVSVQAGSVTQTGNLYHPPATETLVYDLDGNLTSDGRWSYNWDGENRLIAMTTTAAAVLAGVPDLRLEFAYDSGGRRIRKVVEHAVGVGTWQRDSDSRFVYDGWNLLAEVEMHNSAVSGRAKDAPAEVDGPYVRRSYLWGPDLSGTMQGAGGVCGLLAVRRHARGIQPEVAYWTAWDLNGNVIGLREHVASGTARLAFYDYDPFGKSLRVSEPEQDLNPFQFSTKYTDAETGLCYYGYRYYDAVRGRWINRDPIEEAGGVNLYGFVSNSAIQSIDKLGLRSVIPAEKPNCQVILRMQHGPTTAIAWRWNWLSEGFKVCEKAGYSGGLIENGQDVPFYGRSAVLACGFRRNSSPGMSDSTGPWWIPGVKDAYGDLPPEQTGDPKGHVGDPLIFSACTNGGHGSTLEGYLTYVSESWIAALKEGNRLADACATDPCCACKNIEVVFDVAQDGHHAQNGKSTERVYRDAVESYGQSRPTMLYENAQRNLTNLQLPPGTDKLNLPLLPSPGRKEVFRVPTSITK